MLEGLATLTLISITTSRSILQSRKSVNRPGIFNFLMGLAGFEPTLNMIVEVATAIINNQWLLSTEGDGHPYSRFDNHSTQAICGQTLYFQYFQWTFFLSFFPPHQQVQYTQCFSQLQLLRDYFFVFINRQLLATWTLFSVLSMNSLSTPSNQQVQDTNKVL